MLMLAVLLGTLIILPSASIPQTGLSIGPVTNSIYASICPIYYTIKDVIFVIALLLLALGALMYAAGRALPPTVGSGVLAYGLWIMVGGVVGTMLVLAAPYLLSLVSNVGLGAIQNACITPIGPPTPFTIDPPIAQYNPGTAGVPDLLDSQVFGGVTPYENFQWYYTPSNPSSCGAPGSGTAISGATSPNYTVSSTVSGYYCYYVSDSSGCSCNSGVSAPIQLQITSSLGIVSFMPESPTYDSDQPISIQASWQQLGGVTQYTLTWTVYNNGGTAVQTETYQITGESNTLDLSPGALSVAGSPYTFSADVCAESIASCTTSSGTFDTSGVDNVIINSPLQVPMIISPTGTQTIFSGSNVLFTGSVTGGTTPYTYYWLGSTSGACMPTSPYATGETDSPTYNAILQTTTNICLQVSDAATTPETLTSTNVLVVVNPALEIVLTPASQSLELGGSGVQALYATASGGAGTYQSYTFYNSISSTCPASVTGAPLQTGSSNTYAPAITTSGTYYYCANVIDTSGFAAFTGTAVQVTMYNALTVNVIPAMQSVDAGNPATTLMQNPSGGTGSYTSPDWYISTSSTTCPASGTSIGSSSTYPPPTTTPGEYYYCTSLKDSLGYSAYSATPGNVLVNPGLTISLTPASQAIDQGVNPQSLTAVVTGGTGIYTYYIFYSATSGTCTDLGAGQTEYQSGSSSSFIPQNAVSGTFYYCVYVQDSSTDTGYSHTAASVVVNPTLSVTISPSSEQADAGITAGVLTAEPSGGSGTYSTYTWYSSTSTTCPSSGTSIGTASTFTPPTTSQGTFYYCVAITDNAGGTAYSKTATTVTVHPPIVVTISPTSETTDEDATAGTLTSTPTGGTGTYTAYLWYASTSSTCPTPGVSLGSSSTFTPPATSQGTFYYCVSVTDSAGGIANSVSATTVTVNPALTVTVTPATESADQYASAGALTANPVGGSETYTTYLWYASTSSTCPSSGTSLGSSSTYTPPTTSGGTFYYCVSVTDSVGVTQYSKTAATVTIYPALSVTISPTSEQADQDTTAGSLTAVPSGGSDTYTAYLWYASTSTTCPSPGATLGTSSAYTPPTTTTGTFYYCVQVTDSSGGVANSVTATTVTINTALAVTINPTSESADKGGTAGTLTAEPTGGSGTYSTYLWYASTSSTCPSPGTSLGSSSTYTPPTTSTGTFYYCVQVKDSTGAVANSVTATTVTINPTLMVSILPTSESADQDASAGLLTATAAGGSGSYTAYTWYYASSSVCPTSGPSIGTGTTISPSTSSAGTYYYCVEVTDSVGGTANSVTATTVTINPSLAVTITPTSESADPDTTAGTLTAKPTGGSGTYSTYLWYASTSSTCPSPGTSLGSSSTYTPPTTSTGTFYYCVQVKDSTGAVANSVTATTVTINPTLSVTITPTSESAEVSSTAGALTANPTGGSGTYPSYHWYSATSVTCPAYTGVSLGTLSTYTPPTTTQGTYYYCVQVIDSSGGVANSVSASTVTINPTLSITISPTSESADVGISAGTLTATATGGTGSYTSYTWYSVTGSTCPATGTIVESGSSATTYVPPTTSSGTFYYCANVIDTGGYPAHTSSATVVDVYTAPTVTVSANPTFVNQGNPTTLTATASGGSGGYTYTWYTGDDACDLSSLVPLSGAGSSSTQSATPSTSPTYYCVEVTDSNGGHGYSSSPATVYISCTATLSPTSSYSVTATQPATITFYDLIGGGGGGGGQTTTGGQSGEYSTGGAAGTTSSGSVSVAVSTGESVQIFVGGGGGGGGGFGGGGGGAGYYGGGGGGGAVYCNLVPAGAGGGGGGSSALLVGGTVIASAPGGAGGQGGCSSNAHGGGGGTGSAGGAGGSGGGTNGDPGYAGGAGGYGGQAGGNQNIPSIGGNGGTQGNGGAGGSGSGEYSDGGGGGGYGSGGGGGGDGNLNNGVCQDGKSYSSTAGGTGGSNGGVGNAGTNYCGSGGTGGSTGTGAGGAIPADAGSGGAAAVTYAGGEVGASCPV